MKIPLPCKFGTAAMCNGKRLPFVGVSWFQWSDGMEYTYYFRTNDYWHPSSFYVSKGIEQPESINIPDSLMIDTFIKERGFPLKGKGYVFGVFYENDDLFLDFVLTDNYNAHVKVQCDQEFKYIPNGRIIFPLNWDTEEKQERVLLKSYRFYSGEPLKVTVKKEVEKNRQYTIFDYINIEQP